MKENNIKQSPILSIVASGGGSGFSPLSIGKQLGGGPYIDDMFATQVYTDNSTNIPVDNGINLSGSGGLVMVKKRTNAVTGVGTYCVLVDSARGDKHYFNSISQDAQEYSSNSIEFTSTGFTVGVGLDGHNKYTSGQDFKQSYVSWTFRKMPKFFDVVEYEGSNSVQDVPHSLGSVPGCIMIKRYNSSGTSWRVYHRSAGINKHGALNGYSEFTTSSSIWGYSTPTNTTFKVGTDASVSGVGNSFVAYLFAHDEAIFGQNSNESVIKCHNYYGNGAFQNVTVGFEPQWIMVKSIDGENTQWRILDTQRGFTADRNDNQPALDITSNLLESGMAATDFSLTNTGFRLNSDYYNKTGSEYLYIAIRRQHKPPVAGLGTDVFGIVGIRTCSGSDNISTSTAAGQIPRLFYDGPEYNNSTNLRPDLVISKTQFGGTNGAFWYDRVRGNFKDLQSSNAGISGSGSTGFKLAGVNHNHNSHRGNVEIIHNNSINAVGSTSVDWFFRRAPGFFDIVTYHGHSQGTPKTITHNLTTVPNMMIVKNTSGSSSEDWTVYLKDINTNGQSDTKDKYWVLNSASGINTSTTVWNDTSPTASSFYVGADNKTNKPNESYVAYLFGASPETSAFGWFYSSLDSSAKTINLDFAPRFIMFKQIWRGAGGNAQSQPGHQDWFIFDKFRRIETILGEDSQLRLNSTDAEYVTSGSEDYITVAINPDRIIIPSYSKLYGGTGPGGKAYMYWAIA